MFFDDVLEERNGDAPVTAGHGGMIRSPMQWLAKGNFLKTLSWLLLVSRVAANGARI
jgi:hypothetical protein